jgi:Tol biopolymer transport system component
MNLSFKSKGVPWCLGAALIATVAGCGGGGGNSGSTVTNPNPTSSGEIVFAIQAAVPFRPTSDQLFTVNLDGSNLTSVPVTTIRASGVEWFPGRREFVYTDSFLNGGFDTIVRTNREGTNNRIIASTFGVSQASVSPDGRRIAHVQSIVGTAPIFIGAADDVTKRTELVAGIYPSWSSDGKRIVYSAHAADSTEGSFDIYSINVDGTGKKRLTNSGAFNAEAQFSPDGKRIVYTSTRLKAPPFPVIFTVNEDGNNSKRLTKIQGGDFNPRWTLDGSRIVFLSAQSGITRFNVMNADGSNQKLLLNTNLNISNFDLR